MTTVATFVPSLMHCAPHWGLKDLPQGKESYQKEAEVGPWVYSDLESTWHSDAQATSLINYIRILGMRPKNQSFKNFSIGSNEQLQLRTTAPEKRERYPYRMELKITCNLNPCNYPRTAKSSPQPCHQFPAEGGTALPYIYSFSC